MTRLDLALLLLLVLCATSALSQCPSASFRDAPATDVVRSVFFLSSPHLQVPSSPSITDTPPANLITHANAAELVQIYEMAGPDPNPRYVPLIASFSLLLSRLVFFFFHFFASWRYQLIEL